MPLILRWPGVTKAGTTSPALVSQIDLMATFASATGYRLPAEAAEDSHDMLPYLRGESDHVRTTHVHNTFPNRYAIRHGKWLLIAAKDGYGSGRNAGWEKRHGYPPDDGEPVELYNLVEDIGQRKNLADEHPEVVTELKELLEKIRKQGHSAPRLAAKQK